MGGSRVDAYVEASLAHSIAASSKLDGLLRQLKASGTFDVYRQDFSRQLASFTKLLCMKVDGSSTHRVDAGDVTAGIAVYVSRHVPVAAWGPGTKNTLADGRVLESEFTPALAYSPPKVGDWRTETHLVQNALKQNGYELLERSELSEKLTKPLPFDSVLSVGRPTVFDALFHVVYQGA